MTSSHEPWTPIPQTVDWNSVGDGSIYKPMVKGAESRTSLWGSSARTQNQYAKTIGYSFDNLITWAQKYGDENLVLIMFGDHQPMSIVSGSGASHDIPVTVIAHDKSVLERIADWNWAVRRQAVRLAERPAAQRLSLLGPVATQAFHQSGKVRLQVAGDLRATGPG